MSMYTLKSLLTEQSIVIPMIQRDYAQGRTDEHATRIRKEIVGRLKEATLHREHLDFDFIYGTIREGELRLLDGQQRLTTLFLLHWYIGGYRRHALPSYLHRFSFETRISTRDFFDALRKQKIVDIPHWRLSEIICLQKWYHKAWSNDPSIRGALVMLDAIHEDFEEVETAVLPDLDLEEPTVSFQYLDLDGYELDEKLYIKMNSRGKTLTFFEHFKAQFERMLDRKEWTEERDEFARKIETDWSDLLWPYRDAATQTIDTVFLNIFRYITGVLVHRTGSIRFEDQEDLSRSVMIPEHFGRVYHDQETVRFLFRTFDTWPSMKEMSRDFVRYEKEIPLIRPGLLGRLLEGSLSNEEHFIVYAILRLNRNPSSEDVVFVRVLRNLMEGIRQNHNGRYRSNLRFEMFGPLYHQVDDLLDGHGDLGERIGRLAPPFNMRVVEHEKQKQGLWVRRPSSRDALYRLEDHPLLKGLTHRVFPTFEKHGETAMEEIVGLLDAPPALVARSMLSIDDYSVGIGRSNLGSRFVFGGDRYKAFIFTHQIGDARQELNKNLQVVLDRLLEQLIARGGTIEERLQHIVNGWEGEQDWRHYFIRYESILTEEGHVFTFPNEHAYQIERLSGVNLQSAHSNPIYDEVISHLPWMDHWEYYYSELSEMTVGKTTLFLAEDGWNVRGDVDEAAFLQERETATGDLVEQGIRLVHWLRGN